MTRNQNHRSMLVHQRQNRLRTKLLMKNQVLQSLPDLQHCSNFVKMVEAIGSISSGEKMELSEINS